MTKSKKPTTFWTELKQRVLKFETLHGAYLVPLSLLGLYVTVFHLEYVLHALAAIIFCYGLVEGLRKICYNPIKKEALKVINREKYIANHITTKHSGS
jgi:hypothetical protein